MREESEGSLDPIISWGEEYPTSVLPRCLQNVSFGTFAGHAPFAHAEFHWLYATEAKRQGV